jgi:hypothetical protein
VTPAVYRWEALGLPHAGHVRDLLDISAQARFGDSGDPEVLDRAVEPVLEAALDRLESQAETLQLLRVTLRRVRALASDALAMPTAARTCMLCHDVESANLCRDVLAVIAAALSAREVKL